MTISEHLDLRAAERRSLNASYRLRAGLLSVCRAIVSLVVAALILGWVGFILQKSARNLAIDVGCHRVECGL